MLEIKRLGVQDFSQEILSELKKLLDRAYFESKMYDSFIHDLNEKHEYFIAFIAYLEGEMVGLVVLEDKLHKSVNYFGYKPVHIKRFMVDPDVRGNNIGKKLLDELKKYAFEECNLSVFFGESNEVGAISFYLREGALFSIDIIKNYSKRNTPGENLSFFREFITNKKFRSYRYPVGDGLSFVYVKDLHIKGEFKEKGFEGSDTILKE